LPLESLATLDPADPVGAGDVLPVGFTSVTSRLVTCRRGRLTRPLPFVLN
jgi:hypothetical protein